MTDHAKLARIVAAIEAIRDEKQELSKDEREQFEIAKDADIDGKALRRVLQRRAMNSSEREHFDNLVDEYEHALGQKAVARDMAANGKSLAEIEQATGLSHGTAQRAAKTGRTKTQELVQPPPGELTESPQGADGPATATGDSPPRDPAATDAPSAPAKAETAGAPSDDWPEMPARLRAKNRATPEAVAAE
jgi:uncharacterized protein (UPF0335 family)